jgi:hypothetical protein
MRTARSSCSCGTCQAITKNGKATGAIARGSGRVGFARVWASARATTRRTTTRSGYASTTSATTSGRCTCAASTTRISGRSRPWTRASHAKTPPLAACRHGIIPAARDWTTTRTSRWLCRAPRRSSSRSRRWTRAAWRPTELPIAVYVVAHSDQQDRSRRVSTLHTATTLQVGGAHGHGAGAGAGGPRSSLLFFTGRTRLVAAHMYTVDLWRLAAFMTRAACSFRRRTRRALTQKL